MRILVQRKDLFVSTYIKSVLFFNKILLDYFSFQILDKHTHLHTQKMRRGKQNTHLKPKNMMRENIKAKQETAQPLTYSSLTKVRNCKQKQIKGEYVINVVDQRWRYAPPNLHSLCNQYSWTIPGRFRDVDTRNHFPSSWK